MLSLKGLSVEQIKQLDPKGLVKLLLAATARIEELEQLVVEQNKQNQQQVERIRQLEDQVAQNSQNSSKPPSSDGINPPRQAACGGRVAEKQGVRKGTKGIHWKW